MEINSMTLEERDMIKCWLFTQDDDTPIEFTYISFKEDFLFVSGTWGGEIRYYIDIFADYKRWKLEQ